MCGIVGICYGKDGPGVEEWTPSEMAQMMLPASVHRGPHAWGWMSYSGEDAIDIFKSVGRSDTKRAIKSMEVDPNAHWWIGHVRYATHGDPAELINDHPVTHGHITGVHNGVIRNFQEILDVTGRQDHNIEGKTIQSELDSEAIFAAVSKWGHQKGLGRVQGDMVAAYVDHRYPETVRLARTQGRPLWLARTPGGATVFASEPQIITNTGIECTEPSELMRFRLLTLKHGRITGRHNLIPAQTKGGTSHSRVSVSQVPGRLLPTTRFDPFQIRGITDRMENEKQREARIERNKALRENRSSNPADWGRPALHQGPPMPPAAPPRTTERPQSAPASPLSRKAAALRAQILQRTNEAHPGTKVREAKQKRVPSQAVLPQEDGTYAPEHGLYWQDGVMVDINTYIENLLGTENKEATA